MSKYSKIVLNRSGVRQLMRSDEMEQICKKLAYEAKKAKKESKKHNTIIKAVMS